jgi:hypothetical protein
MFQVKILVLHEITRQNLNLNCSSGLISQSKTEKKDISSRVLLFKKIGASFSLFHVYTELFNLKKHQVQKYNMLGG